MDPKKTNTPVKGEHVKNTAEDVKKKLQYDMVKSLINTDTQILDKKHTGKFISNLTI